MNEQPAGDGGQETPPLEQRVGALESGQETLSGKLDQVLGILSGSGSGKPEAPAGEGDPGGDGIAMEIRRQLDERTAREKAERAAADENASRDREVDSLKQQVAALSEKRPEPVVRRVEKMMGWR